VALEMSQELLQPGRHAVHVTAARVTGREVNAPKNQGPELIAEAD
jgi:hypothetical protein